MLHPTFRISLLAMALAGAAPVAIAQDSVIGRGPIHNLAGEWCCEGDCFVVPGIVTSPAGYVLRENADLATHDEVAPAPASAQARCQRPVGLRGCLFAPPPAS